MKRLGYIDILRVISSILIVCVHVSALNWNDVAVNTSKWQVMNAFDCAGIVGVPLFFMISGAIFLNDEHKISTKKLIVNKVLHLFAVYIIWLLFYNILPLLYGDVEVNAQNIKNVFYNVLNGQGIYHLWFLPELMVMYLISPILKKAFNDKKICEYYLILYLIFGGIVQSVLLFEFPYKIFVQSLYNRSSLVMLTGYIGYFVMGHYINAFLPDNIKSNTRWTLIVTSFICYVAIVAVCGYDAITKKEPSVLTNTPYTLSHVVLCFCLFWLIKAKNVDSDGKIASLCKRLSKYTFGVYLLHPFYLQIAGKMGITALYPHTIIMIPVLILSIYIICAATTWIMSHIPFIRYWFT